MSATPVASYLRTLALADVSKRYGAIIAGLGQAIEDVIEDVPPEAQVRLVAAITDAGAQLSAVEAALTAAIEQGKLMPADPVVMPLGDAGDEHAIGAASCAEGWCGDEYPKPCEEDGCVGFVHASFGDEQADGDYWLYTKCDRCGNA